VKPAVPKKLPRPGLAWERLIPEIGAANRALAHYDGVLHAVPNPEILLSPLTTQEAVLSSRIEGTRATFGEVLKFEAGEEVREEEKRLDIQEIINYSTYAQPEVLFDTMGFGKPLDATPMLLMPNALRFAWGGTIRLLAEGLGLELDEIREAYEKRPATKPIFVLGRTVEPGTMAALRFEVQGIVKGRPVLVVEHVTRLDDALAPDWPQGSGSYRVLIKGVPGMRVEFEFWDEHGDHAVGGVVLTATRLVNAIPAVCAAKPAVSRYWPTAWSLSLRTRR